MAKGNLVRNRIDALIWAAVICALVAAAGFLTIRHLETRSPLSYPPSAAVTRKDVSIVFLSGDMGVQPWSLGGRVVRRLASEGYAVTELDMLAALSTRQTPAGATAIIGRAIRSARARNPGVPVALIGQSFGADILPVVLPRLPPELRNSVQRIILIVPATHAYLQVSPAEMLGTARPDADLRPLVARLPAVPITCVYGIEETDTLCPLLRARGANVIVMPGGHFLHGDAGRLYAIVARSLDMTNP